MNRVQRIVLRQQINAARRRRLNYRSDVGRPHETIKDGVGKLWPPLVVVPMFLADRMRPSLENYDRSMH